MASHSPASTNQMTLPRHETAAVRSVRWTTTRPNGHRAYPASLNDWIPNGMPMIVMHWMTPAIT